MCKAVRARDAAGARASPQQSRTRSVDHNLKARPSAASARAPNRLRIEPLPSEKDVQGGNIDTASTPWGELALECVKVVLSEEKNIEEFEGNLQLFAFKAIPSTKRIMISVDDLDDQYGSPNLDDLIAVSRKLNELTESKGFPDDVAIEVASPGAERKLTIPEDLSRFRELKMKVIYNDDENDNPENETMILNVEDFEEESGLVVFRLADVQENRPPKKGMPMSKKKKEWRKKVKYVDIASANLYIDTAI